MKSIENMLQEFVAGKTIDVTLNVAEGLGFISMTRRKEIERRKKGCYNNSVTFLCFLCWRKYGSRNCKSFRKKYNLTVKNFFSGKDIISKVIENAM